MLCLSLQGLSIVDSLNEPYYQCRLLITSANSLDSDLTGPTIDLELFDISMVLLKEFFQKVNFEKNQQTTKKHEKLPSMQ